VTIHDLAIAAGQHRNLETELAEAGAHPVDRGVVLSGIAGVENQPVQRPVLKFEGRRRFYHLSDPYSAIWFVLRSK